MGNVRTRLHRAEVVFVTVCLSLTAVSEAVAQLGSTWTLEDRQAAVARVPVGRIVRARLSDGSRAAGPVARWNPLSVTLGPYIGYADRDTFVALQAIDTLWLRGQATRRWALYGAGAGVVAGGLVGASAASFCPTAGTTKPCAQGAITSAVGGLVIGGLIGWVIGSGTPEWQRQFPPRGARLGRAVTGAPIPLEAAGEAAEFDPRALALVRTRPGALVRLTFRDRPDLAGYVVRAGARRALVAPVVDGGVGSADPIALGSVQGIWERGSARTTGSVIGTLLGFGAGAAVATKSTACDANNDCKSTIIANGALGSLVGWLVGGRVGSMFPKWQRRY